MVISQKTPSGKSVFSIVCGETSSDTKEIRDELSVEAPEGNTEAAAEEEAPEGITEVAAPEAASEGTSEKNPEETEVEAPEEEVRSSWESFIVNRRESYILADGKWIDLTAKEAYDFILGSGKKYVGDLDTYDNLPIKAYLEDAEQAAYPDPAADITVGSMPGSGSKQVIFKLQGRVEEWDTNPEFTWTSSDTGIFTVETVDPEEGVMQITGISPGTAYLMISSEELGTRVVGVKVE